MNRDCLGVTSPPFEMTVERGKIREFARATFTDHPDFLEGRSSPPTFLTTCFHWLTPEADLVSRLELDTDIAVQLQQDFIFHREPPPAGTKLIVVASVEEMYDKESRQGRLECVAIVTQFGDLAGEPVATARMLAAEVHRRGGGIDATHNTGVVARDSASGDLTVGPITMTDIVRYAGASGDFTPVHHDVEFCRRAGIKGPFAMGMLSGGAIGSWLVKEVVPATVRSISVRFGRQVWPGDVLTVHGVRDANQFDIRCTSQDGHVVTSAKATVSQLEGCQDD